MESQKKRSHQKPASKMYPKEPLETEEEEGGTRLTTVEIVLLLVVIAFSFVLLNTQFGLGLFGSLIFTLFIAGVSLLVYYILLYIRRRGSG